MPAEGAGKRYCAQFLLSIQLLRRKKFGATFATHLCIDNRPLAASGNTDTQRMA
jgi:hypothetical protein